jgi:glycosyltransferase involved in cell wall biosynthesis
MAGLICGVPVISTFHGFVDASDSDRLMGIKSRLVNVGSSKIVFVSERLRSHYVKNLGFSCKKLMTIYNGIDTTIFQPRRDEGIRRELGLEPHNVLIGALGNIRPSKGYDLFLRAARIVYDKHPHCRFVIAGQEAGSLYEELLQLRKDLCLEEVFFFLGFRKDTAKVLNNLDLFVLPSVSEGFSISTLEAMACGIPVVVTRSGGPEEIVSTGETGLVVDVGSPDKLAAAIEAINQNRDLFMSLSCAGLELVKERFSLNAMMDSYRKLYLKHKVRF